MDLDTDSVCVTDVNTDMDTDKDTDMDTHAPPRTRIWNKSFFFCHNQGLLNHTYNLGKSNLEKRSL